MCVLWCVSRVTGLFLYNMYICVRVFGTISHCSAVVHVQVVSILPCIFLAFFSIDRYGLNVLSCNVQYTEAASLVYIYMSVESCSTL